MNEKITNREILEFLEDFIDSSEILILEEGKEKDEIIAIAQAKGINLKDNKDLAGFKTIYTFADKANSNKARLPKEKLLKALPTMIGKPVDIDHQRRYVVGHYIDYRYKVKEDMVIAYGVFYKSCFQDEWEEAKRLFKDKKLATSYEVWCPKEKRKYLPDGTYELMEQEIAGGALLFKEKPAFADAKVLELAKQLLVKEPEDLVYASKYNNEDIIVADVFKKAVEENLKKLEAEKLTEKKIAEEKSKEEIKPEDKKEEPKVEEPKEPEPPKPEEIKIKCTNCQEEIDITKTPEYRQGTMKCPKCFAIINGQTGEMIYPPQIKDFKVSCPICKIDNWLIVARDEKTVTVKCQSCAKEYIISFASKTVNETLDKILFLYSGTTTCPQCNKIIYFTDVSKTEAKSIKCPKCGLEFNFKIKEGERFKTVSRIDEKIDKVEKSSDERRNEPMEFKLEISKYHRNIDDFDTFEATLPEDYEESTEVAKKLQYEERKSLSDNMFAVVVRVKNKKTGGTRKIRMFPIHDEAHVRNALARLGQEAPQATLKQLGVSVEQVKKRIMRRAKQLGMTELIERHQEKAQEEPKPVEQVIEPVVEKPTESTEQKSIEEQPKAVEAPEAVVEPKAEETPKATEAPVVEEEIEEYEDGFEEAKKLTYEKRQEIPDDMFAVVITKDDKKIRKFPIQDEAHVRNALARLGQEKVQQGLQKLGVSIESVKNKILKRAKELKMTELLERYKASLKKIGKKYLTMKKELEEAKKQTEFYKENAKKILDRKTELGEFAEGLTDEKILDDKEYEIAKLKKQVAKQQPVIIEESSDKVGDKTKNDAYYVDKRKEINKRAFTTK